MDNYQQLRTVGVGHTAAVELSNLQHVTPAYLTAILADWRSDTPRRRTVGMLIHRIREADTPTPASANTDDDNNRYLDYLK